MPQVRRPSSGRRPQQMLRMLLSVDERLLPRALSASPESLTTLCERLPSTDAKLVIQPFGQPKQALIDGELWPPVFETEHVRSAKRMVPRETDVFVCTYPKCGTTWTQHICSQLLYADGVYGPREGKELCVTSPMIERMGAPFCDSLTANPRLLKTHFSRANCPMVKVAVAGDAGPKYIFAARNPKDCCVSYFHHCRNFKLYNWEEGNFDAFFELFMRGGLAFGDYFEHLLGWLPHLNEPNVLALKYEDMLADLEGTVRRIGSFLGGRAAQLVEQEPEAVERIVAESRLDAMQRDQGRWFPESMLQPESSFIRKGGARDWKSLMSREQSDRMDRLFRKRMAHTPAAQWWRAEMRWDDEDERGAEGGGQSDSGLESGAEAEAEDGERQQQL